MTAPPLTLAALAEQVETLRKALTKAYEWSAGFPLKGAASHEDNGAALVVYQAALDALAACPPLHAAELERMERWCRIGRETEAYNAALTAALQPEPPQ